MLRLGKMYGFGASSLNFGEQGCTLLGHILCAPLSLATFLLAVLKDQKKTKGRTRIQSFNGRPTKVFAIMAKDMKTFSKEAKEYGILYAAVMNRKSTDGVVVWAALMVAPFLSDGLAGIVKGLTHSMNNPINIQWCADSPKALLIFLSAYGTGVGVYFSTRRNYRKGEEHGSAKWGSARRTRKKYAENDSLKNLILTQNVRIGLDGRKHRRNLTYKTINPSKI